MRSDKKKKTDPNRDIDDFLSKFDEVAEEDSKDFSDYLDEESGADDGSSDSSKQTFQWKEIKTVKSSGKKKSKDNAERIVVKDPAPSSIKVERKREDDKENIHTFPVEDLATENPEKPEAVEPQKASDFKPATSLSSDESRDGSSSDNHKSFFKELFSFIGRKNDQPVEIEKPEPEKDIKNVSLDKTQELDELFGIVRNEEPAEEDIDTVEEITEDIIDPVEEITEEDTEETAESEDTADEDITPDENEDISSDESEDKSYDTENTDDNESVDETSEPAEENKSAEDESTAEDETLVAAEDNSEAASPVLDIANRMKEDRKAPKTGYIRDISSGEYRKTDLGKRKRIEYRDIPKTKSKKSAFALFGAKKPKEEKAPKEKKTLAQRLFMKKNPKYRPDEGATYVQDGKTVNNKPWRFSFLKLIRDMVVVGLLVVLTAVGIGAYVIYKAPVYNYSDIYETVATASIVYNDEGKQIDNIYYTENRRIIKYDEMPKNLINAFIAIEDKTFWKHHGFNWVRMIGAVFSSITGNGQISGTSTITQQLSRNVYLPEVKSERTIKRKFLEMYYAARIEHALSKKQIIEAYLNTIYLGHGCYGVNSAANTYFSKSVKDLTLLECASLAALPQAPHNYSLLKYANDGGELSEDSQVVQKYPDKVVTNDISKNRRNLTLDLMLEQGMISKKDYDEAYDKPLNDFINPNLKSGSGNYSYFHEYLIDTIVADLMEQKNMSAEQAERTVYTGGLQIYSTLDSKAQNVVAEEFKDGSNFPTVSAIWRQDGDGNILNNDGQIALYDYDDYFDENDNFILRGDDNDIKFNDDGSAVIYSGRNLNIYETEVDGVTDYSIEFKNYYVYDDDVVYSIQGGYVNIPADYKSGDGDGNVVISADFFNDDNYKESFKRDGNNLIISETGYSIGQRVRQPQGGMVIVQVGTGEVKAMVGGRQFNGQRLLNRATNPRQPGSSIKPLAVYGAALQKSYELAAEGKKWEYVNYKIDRQGTRGWGDYVTVHSSIEDERTRVNGKYWPLNASRSYTGTNNFRTAIQQSINTCAVKLVYQVTPEYAIKQVRKFGISTAIDAEQNDKVNDVNPAAMALGAMTEGVTPLEMALAYAAFPAGGKVNSPICYTKILDRNGDVLLEGKSEQTEALNEGVAWIMTDVLKGVVSRGLASAADISEVDVGGKTGTTNDNYDIWFDGFTPNYAAALWIGTDNNIEMGSGSYDATVLWSKIMEQIPKAKEGEYRDMPSNVVEKWGDYYTEGTETGLTFWSYAAEKKKARDAAYKKWSSERENHKHKVVDVKAGEKTVEVRTEISEENAYKLAAEGKKVVRQGNKYYLVTTKKEKIEEKWHWEYDPGWRDGDFSYKFDGNTYTD